MEANLTDAHILESEEEQKGHHQTEETHGFGQGESQDGVREQLLFQRRVTGVTDDERAENRPDSGTGTGHSHSGGTSSDELGSRINVLLGSRGLKGTGTHHGAGQSLKNA